MTKIVVGIDFGTTNVRIAQWDVDSGENPYSCPIGNDDPFTMPTVIAFQRQRGGNVDIMFGEDADSLEGVPNTHVIRNIKRYALATDDYVREQLEWHLQQQGKSWPTWFDPDTRSIRVWNETMSIEEAIRQILKESISRAGLAGSVAEWRAGCPVNCDLVYRRALVSALDDLDCAGKVEWITQEPLLLLALGRSIESLENGRYLVYDLGGGSFDCAIVEVKDEDLIVLSDESLPTLGGMDVDDMLMKRLGYGGSPQLLRIAKERLSSDDEETDLDGHILTVQDVIDVLEKGPRDQESPKQQGWFINQTLVAMVNAYNKAQLMIDPLRSYNVGGWKSSIESMTDNIDRVLVVGGPTRMEYFTDKLGEIFGDEKVLTADELARTADRADIADAALTALSHGACYMYGKRYVPITIDRIPARITLRVTDGHSTEEDSYEPFHRLPFRRPLAPHVGRLIIGRPLYPHEEPLTTFDPDTDTTYAVLITSPDGDTLYDSGPHDIRMRRSGYRSPRADRIMLVVDRLGGVKVKLGTGFTHVPQPLEDDVDVLLNPPWQPTLPAPIQKRHERAREHLDTVRYTQNSGRSDDATTLSVIAAYGEGQRRA